MSDFKQQRLLTVSVGEESRCGFLLQGLLKAAIKVYSLGLQSSEGSSGERYVSKPTHVVVGRI